MFKKPFNKVVGETRRCKVCDKDFHTFKPIWRCTNCTSKYIYESAKEKYGDLTPTGKWRGLPPKKPYPFDNRTTAASNRFCTIRTALSNAWKEYQKTGDKSVVIAHYDKQLKEIEENGIMNWILDRRCEASKKDTQVKSKNMIRNDYPDTRGHYEY
jgi:hypothetical protein